MGVKSHSSSIEDAQADRARRKADREGLRRPVQPEEPAAPAKKAPASKKAAAAKVEPAPSPERAPSPRSRRTAGPAPDRVPGDGPAPSLPSTPSVRRSSGRGSRLVTSRPASEQRCPRGPGPVSGCSGGPLRPHPPRPYRRRHRSPRRLHRRLGRSSAVRSSSAPRRAPAPGAPHPVRPLPHLGTAPPAPPRRGPGLAPDDRPAGDRAATLGADTRPDQRVGSTDPTAPGWSAPLGDRQAHPAPARRRRTTPAPGRGAPGPGGFAGRPGGPSSGGARVRAAPPVAAARVEAEASAVARLAAQVADRAAATAVVRVAVRRGPGGPGGGPGGRGGPGVGRGRPNQRRPRRRRRNLEELEPTQLTAYIAVHRPGPRHRGHRGARLDRARPGPEAQPVGRRRHPVPAAAGGDGHGHPVAHR